MDAVTATLWDCRPISRPTGRTWCSSPSWFPAFCTTSIGCATSSARPSSIRSPTLRTLASPSTRWPNCDKPIMQRIRYSHLKFKVCERFENVVFDSAGSASVWLLQAYIANARGSGSAALWPRPGAASALVLEIGGTATVSVQRLYDRSACCAWYRTNAIAGNTLYIKTIHTSTLKTHIFCLRFKGSRKNRPGHPENRRNLESDVRPDTETSGHNRMGIVLFLYIVCPCSRFANTSPEKTNKQTKNALLASSQQPIRISIYSLLCERSLLRMMHQLCLCVAYFALFKSTLKPPPPIPPKETHTHILDHSGSSSTTFPS